MAESSPEKLMTLQFAAAVGHLMAQAELGSMVAPSPPQKQHSSEHTRQKEVNSTS
jgi:hypothetical protein